MKVSEAKLEFRKIAHLAERSEAMVLPLKYDEISDAFFTWRQRAKAKFES